MSVACLIGLASGGAALLVLAMLAPVLPRRVVLLPGMLICGGGFGLTLTYLIGGAAPATLALPLRLAEVAITLEIDGLSGFFLLLVLPAAMAAMLERRIAATPFLLALAGAMVLTLLAGDAASLVLGLALAGCAAAALLLTERASFAARAGFGVAMLAVICLAVALAGPDARFTALRAQMILPPSSPAGWHGATMLVLALIAGGGLAGLAPLHTWFTSAIAASSGPVGAVLAGGFAKLGLYVLIRVLFDLCGPATPPWWGVPLLLLGGASAVLGSLRATVEGDIKTVLGCAGTALSGLATLGLGVALAARGADIGPVASLALGAVLLGAMVHGWTQALLALVADAVRDGAGSVTLDRLGGLSHGMRFAMAGVLAGGLGLAALPPGGGFAVTWALLQASIGVGRIGGLGWLLLAALAAAAIALAAALLAVAMVRVIGIAFLGRPRSPRAAAADDAAPRLRWAMLGLTVLILPIGVLPGAVLALADPALRLLTDARPAAGALLVHGSALPTLPGLAVTLLLAGAAALVALAWRRTTASGQRSGPAWDGGLGPAPAWLPFGDPATQMGAAGFNQQLRAVLGANLLGDIAAPVARLRRRLSWRAAAIWAGSAAPALPITLITMLLVLLAVAAWW